MTIISVIIPVFNAQLHLDKCIQSLLDQTEKQCEFIFVNDGSTDNSQHILESYKVQDDRIKIINQKNQGVSVARNNGLKIAQGNYIGFVDADDFIENDYYQKMYSSAINHEIDIVICKYFSSQGTHQFISSHPFDENIILEKQFIQKEIIPYFIGNENLNSIWNKLYKKELIIDNKIEFPKGIALGEDGLFNANCFSKSSKVFFLNYTGYHYLEVAGSATRDFQTKNYFNRIEQEYQYDYASLDTTFLSFDTIDFLKAKKFITKISSLFHEYYNSDNKLDKDQIKKLVAEILNNKTTIALLNKYYNVLFSQKSKYEKIILFGLKYKCPILIYSAIKYSNFRNKK
ncbi:glycosyltransferase family 2 protein [Flavobacterium sp.]|uniref:glycosyltransferase family 2 protein n=1 Tax=Flavobacterium sp. TaxID=239 RepID=UPI003753A41B